MRIQCTVCRMRRRPCLFCCIFAHFPILVCLHQSFDDPCGGVVIAVVSQLKQKGSNLVIINPCFLQFLHYLGNWSESTLTMIHHTIYDVRNCMRQLPGPIFRGKEIKVQLGEHLQSQFLLTSCHILGLRRSFVRKGF